MEDELVGVARLVECRIAERDDYSDGEYYLRMVGEVIEPPGTGRETRKTFLLTGPKTSYDSWLSALNELKKLGVEMPFTEDCEEQFRRAVGQLDETKPLSKVWIIRVPAGITRPECWVHCWQGLVG
jgi:hypothetical protein